jgi:hypothetical protein
MEYALVINTTSGDIHLTKETRYGTMIGPAISHTAIEKVSAHPERHYRDTLPYWERMYAPESFRWMEPSEIQWRIEAAKG